MNNSKIALDSVPQEVDRKPWLHQREGELVKIIEAIGGVASSAEWSSLKTLVFQEVVEKLKKELFTEARKDTPDVLAMARINGQYTWAKKYADLDKLADSFRLELTNIRKQLYGKTEEN